MGGDVAVLEEPNLDSQRPGAAADDGDGLGVAGLGYEEDVPVVAPLAAPEHEHRFRRGGALVKERGVRDRKPREVDDHRLEVEQGLEAPLGDLGLVGRILCIPAGVLKDVPEDDAGRQRPVVPQPEVGPEGAVEAGELPRAVKKPPLGDRFGEVEVATQADRFGNGLLDKLAQGRHARHLQHRLDIRGRQAYVAPGELAERLHFQLHVQERAVRSRPRRRRERRTVRQ